MAGRTGNYFVTIFSEAKRYLGNLLQEGVPLVDGDWNDQSESKQKNIQRPFQAMGKRFDDEAFKVRGQIGGVFTSSNNFMIWSDGALEGDAETWARGWIGGLGVIVSKNRLMWNDDGLGGGFVAYSDQHLDELFHRSYNITVPGANQGLLTDTSIKWKVGELVGRTLYPNLKDTTGPSSTPKGYTITGNTINTITVSDPSSDFTTVAQAGDYYWVGLTTPGSARTDEVYLDIHIEEWNATEDSDLLMPIGAGIECMRRLKLVQSIQVIEDTGTHGTTPADYVDSDGNQHYTVPLASLARISGNANITEAMVTDLRDPYFGSGREVEEARGNLDSLEERIYKDPTDGVIDPDGNLNPGAIGATINHDDLKNMPDTAVTPDLAVSDHDARYGDVTYSNGPGGTGSGILIDDESHRDAISRTAESANEALGGRIIAWMNGG